MSMWMRMGQGSGVALAGSWLAWKPALKAANAAAAGLSLDMHANRNPTAWTFSAFKIQRAERALQRSFTACHRPISITSTTNKQQPQPLP